MGYQSMILLRFLVVYSIIENCAGKQEVKSIMIWLFPLWEQIMLDIIPKLLFILTYSTQIGNQNIRMFHPLCTYSESN